MKALSALFAAAATLTLSSGALATEPTNDMPVEPPHFTLELGAGPSITSIDTGFVKYLYLHGHFDAFIGHELWAGPLGTDRVAIGLGYMGGFDANGLEILHRHGVGFIFEKSWLTIALGGGVSVLTSFDDGATLVTGGLYTNLGFRIHRFQIGLPIDVDVINSAPATTFALTFGYSH